jgi:hypothetical protein
LAEGYSPSNIFFFKIPRWPECHDPYWIDDLEQKKINKRLLQFIEATIKRYQDNENIIYWQVENEPFLKFFGECPPLDKDFLKSEIYTTNKYQLPPLGSKY